jgi:hypothetical protein
LLNIGSRDVQLARHQSGHHLQIFMGLLNADNADDFLAVFNEIGVKAFKEAMGQPISDALSSARALGLPFLK